LEAVAIYAQATMERGRQTRLAPEGHADQAEGTLPPKKP